MMNRFFVEVRPTDTVRAVAEAMKDESVGIVCVTDEGHKPVGVLTDRDLAIRVCAAGLSSGDTLVQEVMSAAPVTAPLEASASEVETRMKETGLGRMLVVDEEGRLNGVVTLAEIWHYESPLTAGQVSRSITGRELRAHATGAPPYQRSTTGPLHARS